jgi:uncharacterized protein (UPF0276 family)
MFQPQATRADHAAGSSPVPARAGIGLKPAHFTQILATRPDIGWFEVHPENYLVPGGPLHHYLTRIRADYPLSFHSVGMSLGSADGVDALHIQRLRALCERYQPALVSDHLSWSRWEHTCLNDLLPLPYTQANLQLMLANVDKVQTILGRRIAIENPSSYLALPASDMDECDFLVELARRSGAQILLDVNNVHVSATNHGWSANTYLERIPQELVSELHLAGHKVEHTDAGAILIDDHGSQVCPEVWALYVQALQHLGPRPTLIEWDTNVPALDVLLHEAEKADCLALPAHGRERRYG